MHFFTIEFATRNTNNLFTVKYLITEKNIHILINDLELTLLHRYNNKGAKNYIHQCSLMNLIQISSKNDGCSEIIFGIY